MKNLENTMLSSIARPFMEGNEMPVRRFKDKFEVAVPDGRYSNGRVKYKRELADTEEEALSREEELLKELRLLNEKLSIKEKTEPTEILFSEKAEKWLRRKKFEVTDKTWDRYDTIVNQHIIPVFGDRNMLEITEDEIRDYFLGNKNTELMQFQDNNSSSITLVPKILAKIFLLSLQNAWLLCQNRLGFAVYHSKSGNRR